jgi:hypothetical protein
MPPSKNPSSPSLAAVRSEEPRLDPNALDVLVKKLSAKTEVTNRTVEQISEHLSEQAVLLRSMRHDLGVMGAQVDKVARDQSVIKDLLAEVLSRLPSND